MALPTGWTVRHLPSAPRCLEPSDPYITHGCDLKQARPGHTEETNRTAPRDDHAPPLTSPEAAASAAANRAPTAAMARSDADCELQCVPADLDSVPTASLSLDAWTLAIGVLLVLSVRRHERAEVDGSRRRCCVVSVLADDDAKGIKDGKMMVMMVK